LLEAAKTGDVERVRDLLLRKADISTTDSRRQTPLELAVFANHGAVVKLLCEHGADINSIIYRAAISGKEAAMNLLIENGADIDYHGSQTHSSTALCHAVNHGNERMACFLIEKGADVNISNCGSGVTALHGAVLRSEGITRALLKANADVNAKDELGRTPLSFAVGTILASRIFNEATTKLLLEAGATVEQHRWDAMPPAFREQNAKYAPKY
jgi:ankyrin repeat protein